MRKKTVKIKLTSDSIDDAINELKENKKWLKEKTQELVDKLAGRGYRIACINFDHADYDGYNDVKCDMVELDENRVLVVALGGKSLFIEFGTGIRYPDDHPYKETYGMVGRGEYGKGKGKDPNGWTYTGDARYQGTRGVFIGETKNGKYKFHTYGNPANRCMYDAKCQVEDEYEEIVRRVFND